MPRTSLEKYRQAAKELRKNLDSPKFRTRAPERAFIDWYSVARFGEAGSARILDGKRDGGIDALIERNGSQFVIQSK